MGQQWFSHLVASQVIIVLLRHQNLLTGRIEMD